MKKILLASTALVLSAGVAAAEVKLSGDGRMGVIYDNGIAPAAGAANVAKLQFTARARVTFTLSGQTDGGLAFGASFRADNAGAGAAGNTAMTEGSIFISGDFGKLSMGDVAGAGRAAVGDLYAVGLTDVGSLHEMAYLDRTQSVGTFTALNRRTSALYEYKLDALTFYASVGQSRKTNPAGVVTQSNTDSIMAVGVKYVIDSLTLSAGYEVTKGEFKDSLAPATNTKFGASHFVVGAEYKMDNVKVKFIAGQVGGDLGNYLKTQANARRTQYGLSVEGKFDALTVTAFAKRGIRSTDYGVGAAYDLGGGASIKGGISRLGSAGALAAQAAAGGIAAVPATAAQTSRTRADLGLTFSF